MTQPDPGTVILLFLLLFAVGWGAIKDKQAKRYKADRDRINRNLKEAVQQYSKEKMMIEDIMLARAQNNDQ